jgi:hypothetical protein
MVGTWQYQNVFAPLVKLEADYDKVNLDLKLFCSDDCLFSIHDWKSFNRSLLFSSLQEFARKGWLGCDLLRQWDDW